MNGPQRRSLPCCAACSLEDLCLTGETLCDMHRARASCATFSQQRSSVSLRVRWCGAGVRGQRNDLPTLLRTE